MTTKETGLWGWLRDGIDGTKGSAIVGLHINRIENSAGNGMPDVEGCLRGDDGVGTQFWIELKVVEDTSKLKAIEFQPAQIPWLEKRWRYGGNAWLLVRIGYGPHVKHYLIRGCEARRFEESFTLAEIEEMSVICPKATPRDIIYTAALRAFG